MADGSLPGGFTWPSGTGDPWGGRSGKSGNLGTQGNLMASAGPGWEETGGPGPTPEHVPTHGSCRCALADGNSLDFSSLHDPESLKFPIILATSSSRPCTQT